VELNPESADRAADRILVAERFLKAFGERLVADGWATRGERRIRCAPILIEVLAYVDYEPVPTHAAKIPILEYAGVAAAAQALRNHKESLGRDVSSA
jgi:hypothetical protein